MANNRTVNLLPEVFRTDTNKKFLNATLDQLISDPNFTKIDGYIGRKFAPTAKSGDYYLGESTALRQNYQLEPSVVVKNKSGDTEFFGNYIDLLQQIQYYGGNIDNQDRLFNNKGYSYTGLFDLDKFVNFNQYYWLPNGPGGLDANVPVTGGSVPISETIVVTRDTTTGSYKFSSNGQALNPELSFAYGGSYNFIVNQPGFPFWIQSETGISGERLNQPNTSSRDVLGVINNGLDVGTVTFNVPLPDAQNVFSQFSLAYNVDVALDIAYRSIQGMTVAEIEAAGGLDGISGNLENKKVIFVGGPEFQDDYYWTADVVGAVPVPLADRYTVWTIKLVDTGTGDQTVNLVGPQPITITQKVFVRSGIQHANSEYFVSSVGDWSKIPVNTASLPFIFYQDNNSSTMTGRIKLLSNDGTDIDIDNQVLGKTYYKSPNGVVFTNGLRITFDSQVTPSSYANKVYFVEGVGTGIRLVPAEQFDSTTFTEPQYITINRSSLDKNSWSRNNCWFHIDTIRAAEAYIGISPQDGISGDAGITNQTAVRPIIEFNPDLQLFNNGIIGAADVDTFDVNQVTNAFNQVEGAPALYDVDTGWYFTVGSTTFPVGAATDRIIFSADPDPLVTNKIFNMQVVDLNGNPEDPNYVIHLSEVESVAVGTVVLAKNSFSSSTAKTNLYYWFDGSTWTQAQQKTKSNQSPLFDIVTASNQSVGEFLDSDFTGTKIFSYKQGTGKTDPKLGFPLSYRNFNNIGDIQFTNDFDNDSFSYLSSTKTSITAPVNQYFIRKNNSADSYEFRNVWTENRDLTKQYQLFNYIFTGDTNYFTIDVTPVANFNNKNIFVFKNSGKTTELLTDADYEVVTVIGKLAVRVNVALLTVGDEITIKIYSNSVSQIGAYEVPPNLDLNSLNTTFTSLTLGQIRNHLITMGRNNAQIQGPILGENNLRDIPISQETGSILQHASPVIYSNLFLLNNNLNFIKSIEYAQKEYSKFKTKFLELAINSDMVDPTDIPASVDLLLYDINKIKNSTFPWYYSDMVSYGDNMQPMSPYQILNPELRQYEIAEVFNDQELSDRAVLVYYAVTKKDAYGELIVDRRNNPVVTEVRQLVKGRDYYFNQDRPAITLTDQVTQLYNDLIVIKDYINTNGSYIPETPTKLGLYPKFAPRIFTDDSYRDTVDVIQGHDGSITPVFNDYRDQLLLELETRIYNNIKVNYDSTLIDIYEFVPGKFRNTEYSITEFNQIITTSFLKWIGSNRVDYITNNSYSSNDAFTWNYKNFTDTIDGEKLPGSWRAVFKYFYDTDRPHQAPWEMLGFSEKPTWWENRYGIAPYTGGNLVLWEDLSRGYIYGEDRIDEHFVRPELLRIIPVDDAGNLRSPEKMLVSRFNSAKTNYSFSVGDIGPTENAWRRSSDYPFALQQTMALMKPGFYFGTLMNVDNYNINPYLNQITQTDTLQRISPSTIKINGLVNSVRQRTTGYINWIGDYLTNLGISPGVKIIDSLKNLTVQLSYKVAGFTDKNYIRVLAEQSSPTSTNQSIIIPDDNYEIFLNKSTPTKKINYSAVIIERSNAGWTVNGYDTENPYFTIIPSLANNNTTRIEVGGLVGLVYQDFQKYKIRIPYGYEFTSRQQIVDFLISYGRYLTGQGMRFDTFNTLLETTQDWILSCREFLTWSQQGWSTGSLLVLSPIFNRIVVNSTTGTVDFIENGSTGSKILDQEFNVIKNTQFTVTRYGSEFTLSTNNNQTIGFAQLNVVQYEHALIFNNTTLFNDIIYTPETGNRQFRLKLVGNRTGNWNGQLDIPGFIYNTGMVDAWSPNTDYKKGSLVNYKNKFYVALSNLIGTVDFSNTQWKQIPESQLKTGLLNNFSYNAQELENIYDINNQPANQTINKFSNGLIGFRERSYLTDLGLNVETQTKFYQGYIKHKGTKNAVNALSTVNLNNIASNITAYEEWALRVGEYGAIDSNDYLEIILDEHVFNSDPETFVLLNSGESAPDKIIGIHSADLYRRPNQYNPDLLTYKPISTDVAIPMTAGYVNLADIDSTIFNMQNYTDLNTVLGSVGSGYKVWVAKDFTGSWNVYRATETNNFVTGMTYALNGLALVTTYEFHSFVVGDIIAIKNFDSNFNGFYRVFELNDTNSFYVVASMNPAILQQETTVSGAGLLLHMVSMRATDTQAIIDREPANYWKNGDRLWVDHAQGEDQWEVYEKRDVWTADAALPLDSADYSTNSGYGSSVKLNSNASAALVGAPAVDKVKIFHRNNISGKFEAGQNIQPLLSNTVVPASNNVKFGSSIDIGTNIVAIGAPGALSNRGLVFLYNYNYNNTEAFMQVLRVPDGVADDEYGYSLSMSKDDEWLFVGAPGANHVYSYVLQEFPENSTLLPLKDGTYTQTGYSVTVTMINHGLLSGDSIDVNALTGSAIDETVTVTVSDLNTFSYTSTNSVSTSGKLRIASYTLTFTPDSIDTISVVGQNYVYVPDIDFTVTDDVITFIGKDNGTSQFSNGDVVTIKQTTCYRLFASGETPAPEGVTYERFGHSVKAAADGSHIIVGAPHSTVDGVTNAGAAVVVNKLVEEFIADGVNNSFVVVRPIINDEMHFDGRVSLDLVTQRYNIDFTYDSYGVLQFTFPVRAGQVIRVESWDFSIFDVLGREQVHQLAYFGSVVDICNQSCSAYIGAPGFTRPGYRSGRVHRYVNQGRAYGTITGEIANPFITAAGTYSQVETTVTVTAGDHGLASGTMLQSFTLTYNKQGETLTTSGTNVVIQVVDTDTFTFEVADADTVSGTIDAITDTLSPVLTPGDSMFIDNIEVQFPNGTVKDLATEINTKAIPGVTASVVNGQLRIDSASTVAFKRLDVIPGNGVGSKLTDVGLRVYAHTQTIERPTSGTGASFGDSLRISDTGGTLFIGSPVGTTFTEESFDNASTYLDQFSTRIVDVNKGAGTVYVYDYINTVNDSITQPGQFSFVKEISATTAKAGAYFGSSFDIVNGVAIIGAPYDSYTQTNAGEVYVYNNDGSKKAWQLVRQNTPKVDTANLSRIFVYNKKTNEIQTTLDLYDPAKGKILGIAEQELDYITSYDPAKYNQNNPVLDTYQPQTAEDFARNPVTFNYVGTTNSWGAEQVGQLWWNLDACRFIDYEQDTLVYRNKNWGKLFPDSVIEICEWVESDLPPGNYSGPGTAKYPDNSTYAISYRVDSATGLIITKYYFWVVNKSTVDTATSHKTKTAADIATIIANPQNAGVSYAAAVSSNAFNLYNINQYVSGTDAVLQIAYSLIDNQNIIHSEYELIREDTATGKIPEKIINKMLDSLVGFTINNRMVPDVSIPKNQQIGIEHRPMQTMFKNRFDALRTFVDYVNQIIINHPLVLEFDTQKFYEQDPYPTTVGAWNLKTSNYEDLDYIDKSLIPTGYKVLVTEDTRYNGLWTISELDSDMNFNLVQVQGHRTDFYVDQVDWYDSAFDNTKEVTWIVDTLNDIETIQSSLTSGDVILVKNDGSGRYAYYQVNVDLTTKLVGLQNGTIQIKNTLYDNSIGNVMFDSDKFDNNRFDQVPVVEIRNIFSAIKDDVFVQTLAVEFNRLFFTMINYLLSEQKATDWIFKSSFISILHDIRKLEQYPSFVRDNQTYYEEYINEVKPYRTQIREYLLNYQGTDTYGSDITDFSLPARYDSATGTYRSPTVDDFGNVAYMSSLPASVRAEYQNWYNNYKYQVSQIVLHDPGVGYTIEPDVIITSGGGSGAKATASIWQGNGAVRSITVTNPGSGYTYAPTVTINGNGSRDTGANIQLGFFPNGTIQTATIVNAGSLFTGNPSIFVEGVGTGANLTCSIDTIKGIINRVVIHDGGIGYYSANTQAIVYDPETNAVAVSTIHNVYYSPNAEKSYNTARTITNKIKFDRTQFTSNVVDWAANVIYQRGDTVRYLGETWRANVTTVYPSARIALASNITFAAGDTVVTYAGDNITGSANVEVAVTNGNVIFVTNTTGVLRGGLTYNLGQQTAYGDNPEYNLLSIPIVNVTDVFDTTEFVRVSSESFDNAMDRTIGWYAPDRYMAPRDLGQLYSGINYPGVKVTGLTYGQTVSVDTDQLQFFAGNSTILSQDVSKFNFSRLDFKAGQTITVSGAGSSGIVEYGNVVTNNRTWFVSTVQDNKISVYYDLPVPAQSANVFINLLDEGPDNNITVTYFNENNPLDLDTNIQSSYLDSALGTRPEDIDITGGGFVDTYSSHAPEELIPGRVYDTLNMEVWTKMLSGTANVGYRIFHTMNNDPTSQLILELSEPITVANNYPDPTWIDQVFMNLEIPQGNANVAFGPGVSSITSNRIPVWDQYQHGIDFYGFVAADDRTLYVDGVDTGATVTGVYKNSWPSYYTINPSNVAILTQELGIADTEIHVDNAYQLPQGGANAALPGAVIINGEKIYYYRNYAKDVVTWLPNTVYATDSIVSYLGQEYVAIDTTANLYGATFEFGNVTTFDVHRLTRLRRGVDGTGAAATHPIGSKVVDASEQQRLTGNVHLTTWLNYTNPYQQNMISAPAGDDLVAMQDELIERGPFEAIGTLAGSITDGHGLEGSSTSIARNIKRAAGLPE